MKTYDLPVHFGRAADFAIEAGVEPDLAPPSAVWGHMRVWCGGIPLGNIDERCCALYPAYDGFQQMAETLDDLWDDRLDALEDEAIWNLLDGLLYGYHGTVKIDDERTVDEIWRDTARYERFNFLTNWGEMFDGYKAFLLCPPGKPLRVLCREIPRAAGLGIDVTHLGFLEASMAFVQWFEAQRHRLAEKREEPAPNA
jgi:hypothetical protein